MFKLYVETICPGIQQEVFAIFSGVQLEAGSTYVSSQHMHLTISSLIKVLII